MAHIREPILEPTAIMSLRPTRITVGMREVKAKRQRWREISADKGGKYLGKHMIPVILGPKKRHYIIDHHHLSLALHDEGVEDILVEVVADLQELDRDAFWTVLDHRAWVHPYDTEGRRRGYEDIPKTVAEL